MACAVVAWTRRGRHPLDPHVFEELDEAATRDVEVHSPDVGELEAEHDRQVRAIEDPVEGLLEPETLAVERERAIHVGDGDPAMEEAGDGGHPGRTSSQANVERSLDRVATVCAPTYSQSSSMPKPGRSGSV
jgi:hypothetical protein